MAGPMQRTKIQNKLNDLHDGDILLPPDADAPGTLEVVPVHNNVNHKVKCNWDPGDGGVADKLSVAKQSGSAMVVGVKEGCRIS